MKVVVDTQRRRATTSFSISKLSHKAEIRRNVITVFRGVSVLTPLLGVPWVFGVFSSYSVVAAYLFVGFSSYQVRPPYARDHEFEGEMKVNNVEVYSK